VHAKFLLENLKAWDHLEDQGSNGTIVLEEDLGETRWEIVD